MKPFADWYKDVSGGGKFFGKEPKKGVDKTPFAWYNINAPKGKE